MFVYSFSHVNKVRMKHWKTAYLLTVYIQHRSNAVISVQAVRQCSTWGGACWSQCTVFVGQEKHNRFSSRSSSESHLCCLHSSGHANTIQTNVCMLRASTVAASLLVITDSQDFPLQHRPAAKTLILYVLLHVCHISDAIFWCLAAAEPLSSADSVNTWNIRPGSLVVTCS